MVEKGIASALNTKSRTHTDLVCYGGSSWPSINRLVPSLYFGLLPIYDEFTSGCTDKYKQKSRDLIFLQLDINKGYPRDPHLYIPATLAFLFLFFFFLPPPPFSLVFDFAGTSSAVGVSLKHSIIWHRLFFIVKNFQYRHYVFRGAISPLGWT